MSDHGMIVQFPKLDGPALEIKRRSYAKDECEHWNFLVDEHNEEVTCKKCGRKLTAIKAIGILAQAQQRDRWITAERERYTQQAMAKTIKAAVIALIQRGVTAERFAELAEKYREEANADRH